MRKYINHAVEEEVVTHGLGGLMYWMATLPSMDPKANPVGCPCGFLSLKMLKHRCWNFKGLSIFYTIALQNYD